MSADRMTLAVALVAIFVGVHATAEARDFDHAKLCEAIRNAWQLRVFYRPGEGERIIIPRFLGYTKDRNVILNGLQISGFSESGNLPGHRSFRLDRATDIHFTTTVASGHPGSGKLPSGIAAPAGSCARGARPSTSTAALPGVRPQP
jgi:hypothetical protein